jgi:hypothetical protein
MNEIIFLVEDAVEGGYLAKALGEPIFTEAETMDQLKENIRESVRCHYEDGNNPQIIRLHYVKDELISL